MNRFLGFDELITPNIISIIYWIGIAGILLSVLVSLFGGFFAFVASLIGGAIGLVLWRVWCEVMLILFRIHDDLRQIARNTTPVAVAPPLS